MIAAQDTEYRKLALDSSNDMIDHDADRGLGRYPRAAWHILQAGLARTRMGQMMFDAQEFVLAAEDWLSASACFGLATDPRRMRVLFDRARQLDAGGKIPPARGDLHAALKEREEEINVLEQTIRQFGEDYNRLAGSTRTASRDALAYLRQQVRALPGLPKLHAEIFHQAHRLGEMPLAVEHLDWAQNFDPNSPTLMGLRVSLLIASSKFSQAEQLSRELLAAHPELDFARLMRARVLVSPAEARVADWQEASAVLQPLVENESTNPLNRMLGISLAAILRQGLGQETEYHRLLDSFDRLAQTVQSPVEKSVVIEVRRVLPQIFPHPRSNGVAFSSSTSNRIVELNPAALRAFESLIRSVGVAA